MVGNLSSGALRPLNPDILLFCSWISEWDGQVTMRDLPGFYWDEERQRYFALQSEPVARSLHQ